MARVLKERGIDLDEISASYSLIPPRMANLVLYILAVCHPPRWLFDLLLKRVKASRTAQPEYPRLGIALRSMYIGKRIFDHLRFMDFSVIPGWGGYVAWRVGIVRLWNRRVVCHYPRPDPSARRRPENALRIPLEDAS